MAVSRVQIVDQNFRQFVEGWKGRFRPVPAGVNQPISPISSLKKAEAIELFRVQITSRWLDFVARELKATSDSFYTIGSSGHEGNAMVGMLSRPNDMAFLHYRSGAFFLARANQVPGETPVFDTCLSLVASSEDPISGGRHKVWGSLNLNVPPQTSTIASHLPKALGHALFLDRRGKVGIQSKFPNDAISICTFGDASSNHSTAVGAINAACWAAFQNIPMPLLFVCEDNGLGISVRSPENWVSQNYQRRPGLKYVQADGLDLEQGFDSVKAAIDYCRTRRRPVFLHLKTVRLLGHAGSDVESNYHTIEQMEAQEAKDPILKSAGALLRHGILSPDEIISMYDQIADQVRRAGQEAARRPKQMSATSVMEPLVVAQQFEPLKPANAENRRKLFGKLPEEQRPRHMAQLINWGLKDLFLAQKDTFLFGEDVAKKGGVYNVTHGMTEAFGRARVFNTLLDEQSILGLAIGAGHHGFLPIPEIQYLAYLHNAIDQLRGEACSLQFFSEGQFSNPMVVRIAGFAYQKGFGGHFHNDNSFAALREIPGLILVTASTGEDAVRLMRTCVAHARQHGSVIAFIEPIALYMTKDLVETNDYLDNYPPPHEHMPFGEIGEWGNENAAIAIVSYANGSFLSKQAIHQAREKGVDCQLFDLRFLAPAPTEELRQKLANKKHVIFVDECRERGSLSEELVTRLNEGKPRLQSWSRICGDNTYIPLGNAWSYVLPSSDDIFVEIMKCSGGTCG